jgi:hypothetical protein
VVLTKMHLTQIHASDAMVGSFISVTADLAMEQVFLYIVEGSAPVLYYSFCLAPHSG